MVITHQLPSFHVPIARGGRVGMTMLAGIFAGAGLPAYALAQSPPTPPLLRADSAAGDVELDSAVTVGSAESLAVRELADRDTAMRIVIALGERRLLLLQGADTLYDAPVAVGKGTVLRHEGREWEFSTPVGVRRIQDRAENPVWVPPEWHYVEVALEEGLRMEKLHRGRPVKLSDGRRLEVRGSEVGVVDTDGVFVPAPLGEELVYDSVLYMPPFGTEHRKIPGELGRFKLVIGDGYLIHGTPEESTVGQAVTHGCLRLRDEDIAFIYEHASVGMPVYIY